MASIIVRFTPVALLGTTSSSRGHAHFTPKPVLDYVRYVLLREYGRFHPFLGYIHNFVHGFKESKVSRRKANQDDVIPLIVPIPTKSGEQTDNWYLHYERHTYHYFISRLLQSVSFRGVGINGFSREFLLDLGDDVDE